LASNPLNIYISKGLHRCVVNN